MSNNALISKTEDGDLQYDLQKVVEYVNDKMLDDIMLLAKDHYVSGFPDTTSQRGGFRTNNSENGWAVRKQQYNHPTLTKTGKLKNSIKIEGDYIVSDTEYGEYHNEGTGRLPRREFLGESEELEIKIAKFIEDKLAFLIL
jgi:phage gpG-like protein